MGTKHRLTLPNKIVHLFKYLVGDSPEFSIENRAFNAICILSIIALLVVLPINIALQFTYIMYLVIFSIFAGIIIFILSRFYKMIRLSRFIFIIVTYLLLGYNYYLNSGIKGPTLLVFFLTFSLIIIISNVKFQSIWLILHVLFASALMLFEFYYPTAINDAYITRDSRFIDVGITFIISLLFLAFSIIFLRKNYTHEKALADKRLKAIEEQNKKIIEQNQVLEKLNREKNTFFSIISHDLKSPLATIQSNLDMLVNYDLDEDLTKKVQSRIFDLTKETTDLITKLLIWSKNQMGGLSPQLENISILDSYLSIKLLIDAALEKKNIEMQVQIDPKFCVIADREMLKLILRNLIDNAIKFTQKDGSIKIITSPINNRLKISIQDSGVGIPEEIQAGIFSFTESKPGTEREKGSGLGLMLCKEFVEKLDGEIGLTSKVGEGSTFYFILPTC